MSKKSLLKKKTRQKITIELWIFCLLFIIGVSLFSCKKDEPNQEDSPVIEFTDGSYIALNSIDIPILLAGKK